MIDISVILVTWNVQELVTACVRSLLAQQGVRLEIILIDNASRDATVEIVRQQFPNVTLIANKENRGFAAANNQGIALAQGRYVLLLNPDTVVPHDTLQKTVAFLDTHPDVAMLGPQLLNADGSRQRSVRGNPSVASSALHLLKLHAVFPHLPALRRYFALDFDYTREQDVDQIMGACMAVRKSTIDEVGTLDEGYFLWFEEVDFCRRLRAAQKRIRYVPDIHLTHLGGQSFQQLMTLQQQRIFNRSLLRYTRKHFSIFGTMLLYTLIPLNLCLALLEPLIRRWYAPRAI